MLPSRGLRPAQFTPCASRQSLVARSGASRKFSSLPRTASLASRTNTLQSARWRTATGSPHVLNASSVRYGSWYAPWSWGKSSTPAGDVTASTAQQVPIAEYVKDPVAHRLEPAVTSTTPELAPAAIEKAPVVNSTTDAATAVSDSLPVLDEHSKTLDTLLGTEPAKDVLPGAQIDPTALIDHAGQLQELGLNYGWGMTTLFEKTIEQVYLQSGWGWAGSIMVAGVAVRCATFFFQALSSDKMAAMAAMAPVTQPIQEKINDAIAKGDKQQEQVLKMQQAQILRPYMGGMFSMGGFMVVQGWIGFCAFRFLRAMGELPVPGMSQDGFLWFTDLTVRDPYFILPAATTGIFYAVFKSGGETGISNEAGQAAQRQKLMTGMAFFLGLVTAFQASALQLYFLVSGILGAGTGWLLRQNGFRKLIGIRALPSKESKELYTKVAKGEVSYKDIRGKDGRIRYQAPTPSKPAAGINRRNATTLSGINIKEGTPIPLHLKPSAPKVAETTTRIDRDHDFEEGAQGSMMEKMDYYRRNYRLSYMFRRTKAGMDEFIRKSGGGGKKMTEQQEKRKMRAEQYEVERRRRFENRS